MYIDNHSSGYLGMAVEQGVRAYLAPHCILAQKQYFKTNGTAEFYSHFYPCLCILKL